MSLCHRLNIPSGLAPAPHRSWSEVCTAALATSADAVRTTSATATPAAVPTPPVSDVRRKPGERRKEAHADADADAHRALDRLVRARPPIVGMPYVQEGAQARGQGTHRQWGDDAQDGVEWRPRDPNGDDRPGNHGSRSRDEQAQRQLGADYRGGGHRRGLHNPTRAPLKRGRRGGR